MKVAIDTNVLAYAEGVNDRASQQRAISLLRGLTHVEGCIPVQVLGELFNVLVRKGARSRADARIALMSWSDMFATIYTTPEIMAAATDLSADHTLGIWDAVIVAASSRAGCRLLLSEDLQDGFTWGGVTVVNPFAPTLHPLLAGLLP